jgi:hypothetical protein
MRANSLSFALLVMFALLAFFQPWNKYLYRDTIDDIEE